jgi:lantibiotic modifying enzyme
VTNRPQPAAAPNGWIPVLDGASNVLALEVIRDIACALQPGVVTEASLAGGTAGLAVCLASLAGSGLADEPEERALEFLNKAIEETAAAPSNPSLYAGFTGAAWAVAHLEGRLFDTADEDSNEAVDAALRELLGRSPWRGDYDIVSGLVGFGVYALERRPRASGLERLELVVTRLDEMAERTTTGVAWLGPAEMLPPYERQDCAASGYNLGLAHGVPGVIAFLGQVCAIEETAFSSTRQRARALLEDAVAWLLAREPEDRAKSFPYAVGEGVSPRPARLGWCYGDLGIATALLQAARGGHEPTWEREAVRIAYRAAARLPEESGVVDCGLCHGASGVAHLFNRLFQATGDDTLLDASRRWFTRTLEMRRAGEGVAGFPAWMPDPARPEAKHWVTEPGLLEGASGIALALLAAATDRPPAWDRMMLMSIPGKTA